MFKQKSLFRRNMAGEALELASWLRVEMMDVRTQIKALCVLSKRHEAAMCRLEGMIADLKQKDLFEAQEQNDGKNDKS
jgi:hypothetical protein